MKKIIREIRKKSNSFEGFKMVSVKKYKSYMIGIDKDDNLVFMIQPKTINQHKQVNSSKGKYLDIFYDMDCEIEQNGEIIIGNYTILNLKVKSDFFETIFLSICINLIDLLGDTPDYIDVVNSLENLRKLFRKTLNKSSKTETGLWGELFVIETSNNKELLIDSWHRKSNQIIDFNDGKSKLEVKTTLRAERVHSFSLNQLEKAKILSALVYSIMTSEIELGVSVSDLYENICQSIPPIYKLKLDKKIFDVAGDRINDFSCKYDYKTALKTKKIFNSLDIPSIDKENIPNEISSIKFEVNLEDLKELQDNSLKTELYNVLV